MKTNKSGFERLRGVAALALMGVGAFMGGSARAATRSTNFSVTVKSAVWTGIANTCNSTSCVKRTTTSSGAVHTSTRYASAATIGSGAVKGNFNASEGHLLLGSSSSYNDSHDGMMYLDVGGVPFTNPGTTVDLATDTAGNVTVTSGKQVDIIAGLDAQVQYWFSNKRPVIRAVFTLTNTSGAPITTNVSVWGNLGSDNRTEVVATQSGDTTIDDNDNWVITDDGYNGATLGDPRVLTVRYGTGAAVVPTNIMSTGIDNGSGNTNDNIGNKYAVTVPAGTTVRLMTFVELGDHGDVATFAAKAADYNDMTKLHTAGLLTGMSAAEIATVVNYKPVAFASSSSSGGGGAFGIGALAALGFAALRRRKLS